ncbi:hypothetical protein KVT40_000396 [Elsinoe batatas]|uniref:Mitochondrial thiamine pyrophosphate carrier 1 n=1 Tax=Elsinoe batatas TaxID=2601811 RepID=A0A8K0L798_9PEZI|nr:hypothetical protein KVT40_000396 [Elsinoe batatas]
MPHKAEALRDEGSRTQVVLAGAVAGLVSRFVIAPLDVIKIRLQLQSHSLSDPLSLPQGSLRGPVYKGTLQTLRTILVEEGITGLWKGNVPAEALYLTYGSIQFLSYRSTTQALSQLPEKWQLPGSATSFVSGAVAGTMATTVTYPLDLLRTRFAAQGKEKVYNSLAASIRDITKHEGFPGFFRGISAGIGQIFPYMGMFFALYENLKPRLAAVQLPLGNLGSGEALAGVLASIMSKTAVFPLDTVRKRLQVQGPTRGRYVHRNIPEYKGVVATVRAILVREGIRSLYRGLPVSLIKAAPSSAVTVWTYERTMSFLQSMEVAA